jgi:hypothetical protein
MVLHGDEYNSTRAGANVPKCCERLRADRSIINTVVPCMVMRPGR